MKVSDMQQILNGLASLSRTMGASDKVANGVGEIARFFEPFKERTTDELQDLLVRADEYHRTGKVTLPQRGNNGRARSAKAPSLTVDEAANVFSDLHRRATDPALSYYEIDEQMKRLEKMTIPQLLEVAAKVRVTVPTKPKKDILAEFTRRIKELKASDQRTQFRLGETA